MDGALVVLHPLLWLADAARDLLPQGLRDHGTNHISRLGGPASHGCVRLHPANAATLFHLVRRFGMRNTAIMISGGRVAKRRARTARAEY